MSIVGRSGGSTIMIMSIGTAITAVMATGGRRMGGTGCTITTITITTGIVIGMDIMTNTTIGESTAATVIMSMRIGGSTLTGMGVGARTDMDTVTDIESTNMDMIIVIGWRMDIAMAMTIGGKLTLGLDTGMGMGTSTETSIGWAMDIDGGTATAGMRVGMSGRTGL